MAKSGRPVNVLQSRLCISEKLFVLGCIPDAKLIDPGATQQFEIAEVKCPYSKFSVNPLEACSDPKFCLENNNSKLKLKTNHEYYDQVQGQMALTGTGWCDFIVYTKTGLSIERIAFDQHFWNGSRDKLCQFFFKHFLPVAAKS